MPGVAPPIGGGSGITGPSPEPDPSANIMSSSSAWIFMAIALALLFLFVCFFLAGWARPLTLFLMAIVDVSSWPARCFFIWPPSSCWCSFFVLWWPVQRPLAANLLPLPPLTDWRCRPCPRSSNDGGGSRFTRLLATSEDQDVPASDNISSSKTRSLSSCAFWKRKGHF